MGLMWLLVLLRVAVMIGIAVFATDVEKRAKSSLIDVEPPILGF